MYVVAMDVEDQVVMMDFEHMNESIQENVNRILLMR